MNNLNENIINTVYIGDTFISGEPPAGDFGGANSICIKETDDDEIDQFRFKQQQNNKLRHAWYIQIGASQLHGVARFNRTDKLLDQFSIKI